MKQIPYQFDNINLEIVPQEIWSNPMNVFHGTTTYHSNSIEKNGFKSNWAPYNVEHVKILVETLKSTDFEKYDLKKGFLDWTTAYGIEHYLDALEKKEFRISFTPLSLASAQYTLSKTKGGQAFMAIREAKEIIDLALTKNESLKDKIPNEVVELFNEIKEIDNSNGIVYIVQLPKDLNGIECSINNVIHSNVEISKGQIIGKVLIPNLLKEFETDKDLIDNKIKSKLHTNGGLAIQILRNEEKEDN
ncbi:hypothetical protein PQ462_06620 [Flavobacterium sp. KACC 22758]|uniref:hypothetical protein n=1 Tax=Flavobacterium sp. KACC 22758 TaxID=3025667 RepID=UPI002365B439|nr:hypothetical protein [Flavobacterium sp. KACC 22758]WDF61034.1 hypothetical protein PQ462_06620 [Flavobacterium sp. KACC 22758]